MGRGCFKEQPTPWGMVGRSVAPWCVVVDENAPWRGHVVRVCVCVCVRVRVAADTVDEGRCPGLDGRQSVFNRAKGLECE
jgi:hypothetical protein